MPELRDWLFAQWRLQGAPRPDVGRVDASEARVTNSPLEREVAGRAGMRGLSVAVRRFVDNGEDARPLAWLREIVVRHQRRPETHSD